MAVKQIKGFTADVDYGEAEFIMPEWMAKESPFKRMDLLSDMMVDIHNYYVDASTETFMEVTIAHYRPGKSFESWYKDYITAMKEAGNTIPEEVETACKIAFYEKFPLNEQLNEVVH